MANDAGEYLNFDIHSDCHSNEYELTDLFYFSEHVLRSSSASGTAEASNNQSVSSAVTNSQDGPDQSSTERLNVPRVRSASRRDSRNSPTPSLKKRNVERLLELHARFVQLATCQSSRAVLPTIRFG